MKYRRYSWIICLQSSLHTKQQLLNCMHGAYICRRTLGTNLILLTRQVCIWSYTVFSNTFSKSQIPICPFCHHSKKHLKVRFLTNALSQLSSQNCDDGNMKAILLSIHLPCTLYSKIHTLSPEIRRLSLVGWNSRYVTRRLCRRITALSTPFGITGVSFT
jgi:hypothetical protein